MRDVSSVVSDRCQTLVAATARRLEWEWDGRFGCVLAVFAVTEAPSVRTAVSAAAERMWTPNNINTAPQRVQDLAGRLGLRTGQLLFTSQAGEPAMVYAAWWPWGNGQRISVRVGVDGADAEVVSGWFGV